MTGRLALAILLVTSTVVRAGHPSGKEKDWRTAEEAYANGKADNADGYNLKDKHDKVAGACGHDIAVKFDWGSIDMATWIERNSNAHATPAGTCAANDQLTDLADGCADSFFSEHQHKVAKKIKTITCHYKSCAKLPDPPSGAKGSNLKATEFQYKLTKGGTNLDNTFCENTAHIGGSALRTFLKKQ